jgi:F-type H+-transporting ATPase subunit b
MDNPLVQVNPGLAIWAIAIFLVLLFLLRKFAWGPLLRFLEAREEKIRKSLDDAQKAQQELERLNRESADIIKKADADAIIRDARSQIETETGKALRQIRSEIADMSVMIASKLIQRNFTKEDNNELIEETLKQIESSTRPN